MLVSLLVVFAIGFVVLQIENLFLLFNLTPEHFFRWQIGEVFCGYQSVIIVQDGVFGYVLVGFSTKDDTYCRIVNSFLINLIKHSDIHIHLPDILMSDSGGFKIYQEETLQVVIIEYKVDIVVGSFGSNTLLSANLCEPTPHLHDELLQMVYNCLLKVTLGIVSILQTKKFSNNGVLDNLVPALL